MSDTPDSSVDFVLTRTFNAPRERVFATMTETDHLTQWWGPAGCAIEVVSHDLRPGGIFHYCMRFTPSAAMFGKFDYLEVVRPERIVFINGFSDAQGTRTRYEMIPTWPVEVITTVTLEEREGATFMTFHSSPRNASQLEIETFNAGHASMNEGFGGMYDVYEKYLATL